MAQFRPAIRSACRLVIACLLLLALTLSAMPAQAQELNAAAYQAIIDGLRFSTGTNSPVEVDVHIDASTVPCIVICTRTGIIVARPAFPAAGVSSGLRQVTLFRRVNDEGRMVPVTAVTISGDASIHRDTLVTDDRGRIVAVAPRSGILGCRDSAQPAAGCAGLAAPGGEHGALATCQPAG